MGSRERVVSLEAADGFEFDAFSVRAEGESRGGLVILHEPFGVTDQLKSVARSYAADGFDVCIPALFDRVAPRTVLPFDAREEGVALTHALDIEETMLDIDVARDHADQGNGTSVLGFCFGGGLALAAATRLSLIAAVSYTGASLTAYLNAPPKCPLLFHFGDTDTTLAPPQVVEQVKAAIPDAETHIYAAGAAFANDALETYIPEAATKARQRSLAFLIKYHG